MKCTYTAGAEGVCSTILKAIANENAELLASIINLSL